MTKKSLFAGTALAKGFETDKNRENDGVWRVHPESGIHVRIRRGSRVEHKRALRRHWKPFAHLTRVDPKDEQLVKMKAGADELVADWGQSQLDENDQPLLDGAGDPIRVPLTDAQGAVIRATTENVLAAFIEMPDFFDWVTGEADTFEHYRAALVEDTAGNSVGSSPGSASGELPAPLPYSNDAQNVASPSLPSSASPI